MPSTRSCAAGWAGTSCSIANVSATGPTSASEEITMPVADPADTAVTVYFEVRVDGKPSDPLQWLKPRLLKTP